MLNKTNSLRNKLFSLYKDCPLSTRLYIRQRWIPFRLCEKLESYIPNSGRILDLGCGYKSPIKHFSKNFYSVGVELFKPYLLKSREARIHDDYILADITRLGVKAKSFDMVVALDVLEHWKKDDGLNLIKDMEKIAKKKVAVLATNGFVAQSEFDRNVFQVHHSGWDVNEFRRMGYQVKGMRGLKFLRKQAETRHSPKKLFWAITNVSQELTYNFSKSCLSIILCQEYVRQTSIGSESK